MILHTGQESVDVHAPLAVDAKAANILGAGVLRTLPIASALDITEPEPATGSFYERPSSGGTKIEDDRLETMSEILLPLSLRLLRPKPGDHIVEVGTGTSADLGLGLLGLGCKYSGVDIWPDAVEKLKAAGLDVTRASATDTGIETGAADAIHSRLVFGWLSQDERKAAFEEMIRMSSGERTKVVIMDASWHVKSGPEIFAKSVEETRAGMRMLNFNPLYGDEMGQEFRRWSDELAGDGVRITLVASERSSIFKGSLVGLLPILRQTKDSVVSGLRDLGTKDSNDTADKMERLYLELEEFARTNPNSYIDGIEMVAQTMIIEKSEDTRERDQLKVVAENFTDQFEYVEGVDFDLVNPENEGLRNVVVAKSSEMIDAARRLQAKSYVIAGLVKNEVLENGMLPEGIDPAEQVERSKYFLAMDPERTKILGMVRRIKPNEQGISSLPGASRMGIDDQNYDKMMVAISAFAKDFDHGAPVDPALAALGLVDYIQREGYEGAIMELSADQERFVKFIFGENSLKKLGAGSIDIKGVEDKKYIYLVGMVDSFLRGVIEHIDKRLNTAKKDVIRQIFDRLHAALSRS